jgi:hypothetical protein
VGGGEEGWGGDEERARDVVGGNADRGGGGEVRKAAGEMHSLCCAACATAWAAELAWAPPWPALWARACGGGAGARRVAEGLGQSD